MGIAEAQLRAWQDIDDPSQFDTGQVGGLKSARMFRAAKADLDYQLRQAPLMHQGVLGPDITLPLPNGEEMTFSVFKTNLMAPELADRYAGISTYRIYEKGNRRNAGRMDLGPKGLHAMFSQDGETVFIDPVGGSDVHQAYYRSDFLIETEDTREPFICNAPDHDHSQQNLPSFSNVSQVAQALPLGSEIRTYRLAIAASGEYSAYHGGTKELALAAIVSTINRVNEVLEREVGVRFELIANTDEVIYLDGDSDPFTNPNASLYGEIIPTLNDVIGFANYDIGHLFTTGGGGLAYLGVVCLGAKGGAFSGLSNPSPDSIFVELVLHEFGHQFGARHTFNASQGNCADNRSATEAYEPGNGTTIMSYAPNNCGQSVGTWDRYYHVSSLFTMSDVIEDPNWGGYCGTVSSLANTPPVPNAGPDSYIPQGTPFVLTGSAIDADLTDQLTYTWEQFDLGAPTPTIESFVDDGSAPLFRSFPPGDSPTRTFPQVADVLSGTATFGETLPTTERELNFQFTVRDGSGGVATDSMIVNVIDTEPFTVTAPADVEWSTDQTATVTWTHGTTSEAPISCDSVEIALSTDGGITYPDLLLTTENDGSAEITVPSTETETGRLRVKCASQPFFNVNTGVIEIIQANSIPVAAADSYEIRENDGTTQFGVLLNDSDEDGDVLTLISIGNPSQGGTAIIDGSLIDYTPAENFFGTETFDYTIEDPFDATATATVTITVIENADPVAADDSFVVNENDPATAFTVLTNDSDAEGDALTIVSVSTPSDGGSAVIDGTSINYTPATDFSGTETFSYTINDDRNGADTATVSVSVEAEPEPATGGGTMVVDTGTDTDTDTDTATTFVSSGGGGGTGSFGWMSLLLLFAMAALKRKPMAV